LELLRGIDKGSGKGVECRAGKWKGNGGKEIGNVGRK